MVSKPFPSNLSKVLIFWIALIIRACLNNVQVMFDSAWSLFIGFGEFEVDLYVYKCYLRPNGKLKQLIND